ncbi:MAG: hypothetical protein KAQ71_08085 [Desulfobulbaceae bacterium]|nr:hypothetical protein [Desulfobulbaceae bacterium]
MKLFKMMFVTAMTILFIAPAAFAGDFGWSRDFNIQAQADQSGFRARLATRFNIGDLQVKTVLSNVGSPADAYLMLRLGEMSGRPTGYVLDRYNSTKKKGWGALAKSLGIKPGSSEFHALKAGHDLNNGYNHRHVSYSSYDDDRGRVKGKGKGKGKKNRK